MVFLGFLGFSYGFLGFFLGFSWVFLGFSWVFLWFSWVFLWFSWVFLWFSSVFLGFSLEYYGFFRHFCGSFSFWSVFGMFLKLSETVFASPGWSFLCCWMQPMPLLGRRPCLESARLRGLASKAIS